MKKKCILYIHAHGFKHRDRSRYELPYFKEKFKIETVVHDLMDYAFPDLKKADFDRPDSKNVFRYDSFKKWKKDFTQMINDKNIDLKIINLSACINLQTFKILNEIHKSNIKIMSYSMEDVPISANNISFLSIPLRFIKNIINYKKLIYQLKKYVFSILEKLFIKNSDYIFINSTQILKKLSDEKDRKNVKIEIIKGNSIDYSNFIISHDENKFNISNEKYGVFIDTSGPKYFSDDLLEKVVHPLTTSKWYPSLSKFFDKFEKLNNLKIFISSHPKKRFIKYPAEFYGRQSLSQKLSEIVKNCEFICTRNSTGVSYGIAHKKPIIILYSDELKLEKNKNYMRENDYFASELSAQQININDFNDYEINLENIKIDEQKYENYKYKYLTALKKNKPNYKIIAESLFN